MDLKDKVVLITGSSIGIGKETAIALAKKGCKVIVTYNKSKKEAEEVFEECKGCNDSLLVQLDVSNDDSIRQAEEKIIDKFGKIDILINNAGIVYLKYLIEQSFEEIEKQVNINLTGLMKITSLFLPHLKKQEEALIINISSTAGAQPFDEVVPYCATKYGVRGFTQSLALELPDNIRTYSVNPGLTATPMTNFKGVPAKDVAEIIVKTAEETLDKKSGEDIFPGDYIPSP